MQILLAWSNKKFASNQTYGLGGDVKQCVFQKIVNGRKSIMVDF